MTTSSLTLDDLLGHAGWMRRLARGLLHDDAAAEDAVQDTLATALGRAPSTGGETAAAWFGTVLLNRIRSGARRAASEARTATAAARQPVASTLTPEEILGRLEVQRRLAALVLALPEPGRQVVYLRY